MTATKFPGLGSVSTATHRTEDLIPAFEDTLRDAGVKFRRPTGVTRFLSGKRVKDGDETAADYYLQDDLWPALEDLAAPYTHFGAHEGDGADFGFWVSWDSIEEDRESGELPAGDELPDPTDRKFRDWTGGDPLFLHVSDHGNAELYRLEGGEWVSLWSVV